MKAKWLYLLLFFFLPLCYAQEEEIQKLLQLINDKDQDIVRRSNAIHQLGLLKENAASTVPTLSKLLLDENEESYIKIVVLETLGTIGEKAAPAVSALIKLLDVETVNGSITAFYYFFSGSIGIVETLGKIGEPAAPAVPALRAFVQKARPHKFLSDRRIINQTACALGRIGEKALPTIFSMLEDPNLRVVTCALIALGNMRPSKNMAVQKQIESVIPLLAKILMEKKIYAGPEWEIAQSRYFLEVQGTIDKY